MLKLLPVVLLICSMASVSAEVPSAPRAGRGEIRLTGSYFSSNANYLAGGGSSESLPNDGEFSNIFAEGTFIYDWKPDWRVYGGANFSYAESFDGEFARTSSGFNEIVAGVQKWYEMGSFDIAPQADFFYPIYKVDEDGDDALIGEGAIRIRTGAWAIYPSGALKPFGYLGFEWRNGGRSFLLPYGVGAKFRFSRSFWLQGEYRGYETVVDDADSENRAERDLFLEQVNGGSYRYYSINPSVSEIALEAGTQFGAVRMSIGAAITVNGSSAAEGWTAFASIGYTPRLASAPSTREDDFDIRGERYDESLFREDPNFVEPPVVAPPVVKPARPMKSPKQQAIEESQDVEMQIELQHVPPKKKKPKKKKPKKSLDKLMKETEKMLEGA